MGITRCKSVTTSCATISLRSLNLGIVRRWVCWCFDILKSFVCVMF